jgi:membrane protease YdiL (CAAX protease family)
VQFQEKTVAASLFIGLSLALPILASGFPADEKPRSEDVAFLVQSALVELKLDVWTAGRPEFAEAVGGSFFSADNWIEIAQRFERPEDRGRLLKPLAVACMALERKEDADKLVHRGQVTFEPTDPFAFLVTGGAAPARSRLTADAEASPLPEWLTGPLVSAWSGGSVPAAGKVPGMVGAALHPSLVLAGVAAGGFLLLFFAGTILLALARRVLRAYPVPVWSYGSGRFECNTLQTFAVFGLWLAAFVLVHVMLAPLLSGELSGSRVIFVVYLAHAAVGVWLVRKWGNIETKRLAKAVDLDHRGLTLRHLAFGVGGAVAAVPAVLILMQMSLLLFGGEDRVSPAVPVLVDAQGDFDRVLLTLNVVLVAPLFEEFLFRGFLFQQFRRYFGPTHGVCLSALVFAAIHQSIEFFVPLFGLGVILALVYHHTQNLWVSVLTHALYNGFTVVLVAVLYGWA